MNEKIVFLFRRGFYAAVMLCSGNMIFMVKMLLFVFSVYSGCIFILSSLFRDCRCVVFGNYFWENHADCCEMEAGKMGQCLSTLVTGGFTRLAYGD